MWVRSKTIIYVSCYLRPSGRIQDCYTKLEDIEDFAREASSNIIVAGEFNAKAVDWGMPYTKSKGEATLEIVSRLGLDVLNVDNTTNFRRANYTQTIIDVSECLNTRVNNSLLRQAISNTFRSKFSTSDSPLARHIGQNQEDGTLIT